MPKQSKSSRWIVAAVPRTLEEARRADDGVYRTRERAAGGTVDRVASETQKRTFLIKTAWELRQRFAAVLTAGGVDTGALRPAVDHRGAIVIGGLTIESVKADAALFNAATGYAASSIALGALQAGNMDDACFLMYQAGRAESSDAFSAFNAQAEEGLARIINFDKLNAARKAKNTLRPRVIEKYKELAAATANKSDRIRRICKSEWPREPWAAHFDKVKKILMRADVY